MKNLTQSPVLAIVAFVIVLATVAHAILGDVSIFHGMILHTIFLLTGLSMLAYFKEQTAGEKSK